MYHLRLKGDHYEMGVKRGKLLKKTEYSFPSGWMTSSSVTERQVKEFSDTTFPRYVKRYRG